MGEADKKEPRRGRVYVDINEKRTPQLAGLTPEEAGGGDVGYMEQLLKF